MDRKDLRREQYIGRRQLSGSILETDTAISPPTDCDDFWVPPPPFSPPPSPPPPPPPNTTPPPNSTSISLSSELVDRAKISQFIVGRKSIVRQGSGTRQEVSHGIYLFRKAAPEYEPSPPPVSLHNALKPSPHVLSRTPTSPPPPPSAGGAHSPPKPPSLRQEMESDVISTPSPTPKTASQTRPLPFERDASPNELLGQRHTQHYSAIPAPPPPPPPGERNEEESQYSSAKSGDILKEFQESSNWKYRQGMNDTVGGNAPPVSLGPMAEIMERRKQMGVHMDSFDK